MPVVWSKSLGPLGRSPSLDCHTYLALRGQVEAINQFDANSATAQSRSSRGSPVTFAVGTRVTSRPRTDQYEPNSGIRLLPRVAYGKARPPPWMKDLFLLVLC